MQSGGDEGRVLRTDLSRGKKKRHEERSQAKGKNTLLQFWSRRRTNLEPWKAYGEHGGGMKNGGGRKCIEKRGDS